MPGQGEQRSTLQVEKLDSRACLAGTHPAACGRRARGVSQITIVGIREAPGVPGDPGATRDLGGDTGDTGIAGRHARDAIVGRVFFLSGFSVLIFFS